MLYIIAGIVGIIVGFAGANFLARARLQSAQRKAKEILENALREAEAKKREAYLEAREEVLKEKVEIEKEVRQRRKELEEMERRLVQKEENLEKKLEFLDKKEREILAKEKMLAKKEEKLEELSAKYIKELEKVSKMSVQEARQELMRMVESEARSEAARLAQRIEDEARQKAERRAKEIIATAIQRLAPEQVAELTVSVVHLPSDDMKGRIIGREGRNIRAFEAVTGVDLIIDDTPEAVVLSCFDPMRREIARIALERLVADGRIHPARIEEVVEKVRAEIEESAREEGEKIATEMGIVDIHPELLTLLGKLKYRMSYGQNVLVHSKEVAHLAGMMACELGLDENLAKRGGLLHDIGKAVQEEEGAHAMVGAQIAKRFHESAEVVNIIASHHEDEEPLTPEAVLVQAADALSAARPGARKETVQAYLKRLQKLEEIASSFEGVDKAYAIQAGREVRIIVIPELISDEDAQVLAREIAKRIEQELTYPGQIKVTVIRETRAYAYAR